MMISHRVQVFPGRWWWVRPTEMATATNEQQLLVNGNDMDEAYSRCLCNTHTDTHVVYTFCTTFRWFSIEYSIFAHWLSCATTCIDLSFMHIHVKLRTTIQSANSICFYSISGGIRRRCNSMKIRIVWFGRPCLCRRYKIGCWVSLLSMNAKSN